MRSAAIWLKAWHFFGNSPGHLPQKDSAAQSLRRTRTGIFLFSDLWPAAPERPCVPILCGADKYHRFADENCYNSTILCLFLSCSCSWFRQRMPAGFERVNSIIDAAEAAAIANTGAWQFAPPASSEGSVPQGRGAVKSAGLIRDCVRLLSTGQDCIDAVTHRRIKI